MTSEALIKSISVEALLERREAVIERLQKANVLLTEANALAPRLPRLLEPRYSTSSGRGGPIDVPDVMREVDASFWSHLLEASGIRTIMDAEARRQWDDKIGKYEYPPLTLENVRATFAQLFADRQSLFERGVVNCFRRLSWDHKTNKLSRFGRKIIVDGLVPPTKYGGAEIGHYAPNHLDDLNRVFHLLDGEPEPDWTQRIYEQLRGAGALKGEGGEIELPYFRLRWFKKGTGHLLFRRLDLVDELNRILAKHHPDALPPADGESFQNAELPSFVEARRWDRKRALGFFPTPPEVVRILLEDGPLLEPGFEDVLEPSAGHGAIARALHLMGCRVTAIEIDEDHEQTLRDHGRAAYVYVGDFLEMLPEERFDAVAMNPPFSFAQDIAHVLHAWKWLRPGGRLGAIMSPAWRTRSLKTAAQLRSLVEAHGGTWEPLPDGAFAESGTMVASGILRMQKPKVLA